MNYLWIRMACSSKSGKSGARRRAAPPGPRHAAGNGRPARSPGPANGRLRGVKGERPAKAGRLAALDEKYGLIANREVTSTTSA